jgi:hypothetical protein
MKGKIAPKEYVDKLLNEDDLFEMSNYFPEETGLPFVVWFINDDMGRHHLPRGKVRVDGKEYPFSISPKVLWLAGAAPRISGKEFKKLQKFVGLNREAILAHWNNKLSSGQLGDAFKK